MRHLGIEMLKTTQGRPTHYAAEKLGHHPGMCIGTQKKIGSEVRIVPSAPCVPNAICMKTLGMIEKRAMSVPNSSLLRAIGGPEYCQHCSGRLRKDSLLLVSHDPYLCSDSVIILVTALNVIGNQSVRGGEIVS